MTIDNPTCQHYRIDNATWHCVECGELMSGQQRNVYSVPLAHSRARAVPIKFTLAYECRRCARNAQVRTLPLPGEGDVTWPCGGRHKGDSVPLYTDDTRGP